MDTGAQHGLVGDNFGTDLPETKPQEEDLKEELHMAKFSQTAEFKKLKQYLDSRIEFYQSHLPDGRDSSEIEPGRLGEQWMVANSIIREFKAVISAYENAQEAVKKRHG